MKSIILWLLLGSVILAQPRVKSFLWEVISFPEDSGFAVYLSYKVSHDLLVFTRNGNEYTAGVRCFVEVYQDETVVKRNSGKAEVTVENYESTNSADDYLQGVIRFYLPEGTFKVVPEFELNNTDRIARIPGKDISLAQKDSVYLSEPICVLDDDNNDKLLLANSGGVLPLSAKSYAIIIPANNLQLDSIEVDFEYNDSTVTTVTGKLLFTGGPEIIPDSDHLVFRQKSNEQASVNYYIFKNFSRKLDEGKFKINVNNSEDSLNTSIAVDWVDKPRSLYNPEDAIGALRHIEKESVVRDLLHDKEENYYKALKEYWRKFDRDKSTAYNEVMAEYYSRVDTADLEYSVAGEERGSETDRGKIYIKFGRPDKIERSYYENNSVAELWIYSGINRKFLFKDNSGLGNYSLTN